MNRYSIFGTPAGRLWGGNKKASAYEQLFTEVEFLRISHGNCVIRWWFRIDKEPSPISLRSSKAVLHSQTLRRRP